MLKCKKHRDPPVREYVLLGLHVFEEPDQEGRRDVEGQVAHDRERGQRPVQPERRIERREELCVGYKKQAKGDMETLRYNLRT